jgi:hypothetical protein
MLTIVWAGLTFGWTESPGEFGVAGWGISQSHARTAPPKADLLSLPDLTHWNRAFVDDGVAVDLVYTGARAHHSTAAYISPMSGIFSVRAPAWNKIAAKGMFDP